MGFALSPLTQRGLGETNLTPSLFTTLFTKYLDSRVRRVLFFDVRESMLREHAVVGALVRLLASRSLRSMPSRLHASVRYRLQ